MSEDAGGLVVPGRSAKVPHDRLAVLYLQEKWTHKGRLGLRWWRQTFWGWQEGRYVPIDPDDMEVQVLAWLISGRGTPTSRVAGEVTKCLKSLCRLPGEIEAPCWLGEGGPPEGHHLVSMANGIVDLDLLMEGVGGMEGMGGVEGMEGENPLRPHSPQWFSPVTLEYPFVADAKCPRWQEMLATWMEGDETRIMLLQEWFGYCLTGRLQLQRAMIWKGEGANGKTVAAEVLQQVLGESNCSQVPLELFNHRFQLAATLGKLVNICGDTARVDQGAEGHIKLFVSGEPMSFDCKYKSPIRARPTARLLILTNYQLHFDDPSDAFWRRLILIPWRVVIPKEERDVRLVSPYRSDWPLRNELPGIFLWAVAGLKRLLRRQDFTSSALCEEDLNRYRRDVTPARLFLAENCRVCPDGKVSSFQLYTLCRQWCIDRGYPPPTDGVFGKEVKRFDPNIRKGQRRVGQSSRREWIYVGIEPLNSPAVPAVQPAQVFPYSS